MLCDREGEFVHPRAVRVEGRGYVHIVAKCLADFAGDRSLCVSQLAGTDATATLYQGHEFRVLGTRAGRGRLALEGRRFVYDATVRARRTFGPQKGFQGACGPQLRL